MFTGIIEEIGHIDRIIKGGKRYKLRIRCNKVLGNSDDDLITGACQLSDNVPTAIGDSISVNGICLTVTELTSDTFTADVMPETISRTSLSGLSTGSPVDLERAMPADGRFGGHIVSGHIDGTGTITDIREDGNAKWFTLKTSPEILSQIVEKGSIAIDGISLTVATCTDDAFSVSIIPHTMEETVLDSKSSGSIVNLETDIIGKYVRKLITQGNTGIYGSGDKGGNASENRVRTSERDFELLDLL